MSKTRKGPLATMHPIEYGAQVLKGVLARVPQLKAEEWLDALGSPDDVPPIDR